MFFFVVINRFPVNVSFFLSFLHFKHLVLVLLLIFFNYYHFSQQCQNLLHGGARVPRIKGSCFVLG